ncbi:hypothetical protein [Brachybacterium alimentarium]|uniref:hypothetical protein n=1 Tax=Brachybacterium alimentarium TaxID=47845 RepID=UPI003FD1ACB6
MTTFTAASGDDGEPRLTDEQRAAILSAMSTPALTASMERVQSQLRLISEQVNGLVGRAVAAQLEPVLRASRIQTSISERVVSKRGSNMGFAGQ